MLVALASRPAVVAASTLAQGEDVDGLTTAGLDTSATFSSMEGNKGSAVDQPVKWSLLRDEDCANFTALIGCALPRLRLAEQPRLRSPDDFRPC